MSGRHKVLLADDSRFFRAIESKFLQKTPIDILEADSTESALEIVRSQNPDLIYMAYSLLGVGGAECCCQIKSDPESKTIPVVMICDQNEPMQVESAKQNGCDAILIKPLSMHSFLQVGRQFLEKIREHRQPTLFSVKFSAEGKEYSGKCLDISGGGLFVETAESIPQGGLLNLSFRLPDVLGTQVECSAEVMWLNCRPNPMKPHYPQGLGLKFIALQETLHKAVLAHADKSKK